MFACPDGERNHRSTPGGPPQPTDDVCGVLPMRCRPAPATIRPHTNRRGAVMSGMRTTLRLVGCVATLTLIGCGLAGTAVSADVVPITYRTYFPDPGPAGD